MVNYTSVRATVPASDMARALQWYADRLGLHPTEVGDAGAYFDIGSSRFLLYPSPSAGTNQATAMSLQVEDIHAVVAELKSNGVVFEEYDLPDVETTDNIATFEAEGRRVSVAWFKDSEGNILAVGTS